MPAIAPLPPQSPFVVVWDMPFAASNGKVAGANVPFIHGDSSRKTAHEAAQAIRRFRSSLVDGMATVTVPETFLLNPLTIQNDLRAFAATKGVDFDAIVRGASQHFVSPVINRRTEPLTEEELESLFEDDQRAFDR